MRALRAEPRVIKPQDQRPLAVGLGGDLRVVHLKPLLDRLRVALKRAARRHLGREPHEAARYLYQNTVTLDGDPSR